MLTKYLIFCIISFTHYFENETLSHRLRKNKNKGNIMNVTNI